MKNSKPKSITCFLCGNEEEGMGHNPQPLAETPDDRCCTDCNTNKVIPARIAAMRRKRA